MVKGVLLVCLSFFLLYGDESVEITNESFYENPQDANYNEYEIQEQEQNPLLTKIKSFLETAQYEKNEKFIKIIFDPQSDYYKNERIDVVKVVKTLKDNGLLKLFFKKPQRVKLSFLTNGSPLLFVKLMSDALRNIGYYRYVTVASNLDASNFTWEIALTSEYATDPIILQKELRKSGCEIVDLNKISQTQWEYFIDMERGSLDLITLKNSETVKLKRSLYAHWLDSSRVKKLRITSAKQNNWHPYIAFYDSSLHLLRVVKKEKKYYDITLRFPRYTKYIKISDTYTLKNIKNELILHPRGVR